MNYFVGLHSTIALLLHYFVMVIMTENDSLAKWPKKSELGIDGKSLLDAQPSIDIGSERRGRPKADLFF